MSTASTPASSSSLARSSLARAPSLARFVEELSVLEPSRGPSHYDRLPDGRTTLTVRSLEDGRGDVCVMGPHSRARFKDLSGVARAVVVHFKPGWSPQLLGVPAITLTDRIVPLADVWGRTGATLSDELLATVEVDDMLGLLSRTLDARGQREEPASASLVRRAVRLLEEGEGRVERLAERLGVTARHLRRAFAESVGIGPKEFARTVRLSRAVKMATSSIDWARIASDAGYYDQAHLIRDFRELVGLTPGTFLTTLQRRARRA